ncbi:hypothetical protein [Flavobacterium sp. 3HN19-14]|uniref:hypothetical protein n=1 Tax=Flavobacterium sp. 3HN19-14 TaxID=3448133 RepID=UPI003EDFFECE
MEAANGTGGSIPVGQNYTTNQVIYVHAVNGTAPNTCESDAMLTINIYNVDQAANATVCGSYQLPNLTVPGAGYYTGSNGACPLAQGSSYSNIPGTYTLYVYGMNPAGTCSDETTFQVTINDNPTATAPSASQTTFCDADGLDDGVTAYDLDGLTSTILGTQSSATYEVKYYQGLGDIATNNFIPVNNDANLTDTSLPFVYAVVTNIATPLCYTPIRIDMTIIAKPKSDPLSGVICVDRTNRTNHA